MIIEYIEKLDIGNLGKQRVIMKATADGNMIGHHLFVGKMYLYSFPHMNVLKGDFIVLYIKSGKDCTQLFRKERCHFLYLGQMIRFWEDEPTQFRITYQKRLRSAR